MQVSDIELYRLSLEAYKQDLGVLQEKIDYLKFAARSNPPRPIKDVMIQQFEQKRDQFLNEIKSQQKCIFRFELNEQIKYISSQTGSGRNLDILRSLRSISDCLNPQSSMSRATSRFQEIFGAILNILMMR